MSEFFQDPPRLGNTYEIDEVLRSALQRMLPPEVLAEVEPGLVELGARAAGELMELADRAEAEPPRLVGFDPWGRRVDRIETSPAWDELHRAAAREGVVACAYERAHGAFSRLHQFARLYLYHPSSAFYSCPLAMTDGAARVLETHPEADPGSRLRSRLTSRDPAVFWTAGQWMTERSGGSDVARSETVAEPAGDGTYRLTGTKWFTSATTAEVALTLGRLPGAPSGSRGLSMFLIETRNETGGLAGIRILRLKDKLGTRALPTAELALEGAPARLVGEPGRGVATIATVLNVTRLYNSCCAASTLARALQLARDFAGRREAFGRRLLDHPLHVETLLWLAVEQAGALHLTLRAAGLMGREETGAASGEERALLRLLTPLTKAMTGKQAVAGVSEALECFGGAGYVEDTGLPRLLRDAQVLPIWEGTTNVLALDFLRAAGGPEGIRPLLDDLERHLFAVREPVLAAAVERARSNMQALESWYADHANGDEALEGGARRFALGLARAYAGALLLSQADWELAHDRPGPTAPLAVRWTARPPAPAPQ
jgi:alkylation response protein AidB-like acyl-CoA dehydrogenase